MKQYKHKKTGNVVTLSDHAIGEYKYADSTKVLIPAWMVEDSADWELVEELDVPIGTQFTAGDDLDLVYTITRIEGPEVIVEWCTESGRRDNTDYDITTVNNFFKDGTWVIYKPWVIQSYKHVVYGKIWNRGSSETYTRNDDPKVTLSTAVILKMGKAYTIHSVKRLSDGEVFTVGENMDYSYDLGKFPDHDAGCPIHKFTIENDEIYVNEHHLNVNTRGIDTWVKPKPKKKFILRTEDGYNVYEGMSCYYVLNDTVFTASSPCGSKDVKYFKYKKAAEQYVFENKQCLSLNDVRSVVPLSKFEEYYLRQLAKGKK